MRLFRKKNEDKVVIDEDLIMKIVNEKVDNIYKRLSDVKKENIKLKRIIKYSKDEPTYKIEDFYDHDMYKFYRGYKLFMYINREEYEINLPKCDYIVQSECELKVENNIAYFTISMGEENLKYELIIDYKNGTYIVKE